MICPKCREDRAHRSHRSGLKEWAASLFGYYPYRCGKCGQRSVIARNAADATGAIQSEIVRTQRRLKRARKRLEALVYGSALLVFLAVLYYITRQHAGGVE